MDLQEMMGQVQQMVNSGDLQLPDLSGLANSAGGSGGGAPMAGSGSVLQAITPILSKRRQDRHGDALKIAQMVGMLKNFGGTFNG